MDWQVILAIIGLFLWIALMMKGGGMGCCGTRHGGHHKNDQTRERPQRTASSHEH